MSTRTAAQQVRWGIAGPGRIASSFVADFTHVTGAAPWAVGSRDAGRAGAFAARHRMERSFGSYRELCACPEVDVVYVATPHPQHKAIALEAIANGKAVLVEKAFAATLAGAQQVVDAARREQVFAMEAMWTRFHPVVRRLHQIVDSGQLGTLVAMQGDLFAHQPYNPDDRLFAKALGGGAMLDLGVYVLAFAQDFLGGPDELVACGSLFPNGVDAQASLTLGYRAGAMASLAVSLRGAGPARMALVGDQGWAEVHPQFHHSTQLSLHRRGTVPRVLDLPPTGAGYSHEIEEVSRCVREGRLESELMPLADTLAVQAQLEEALGQLGVEYADDEMLS